MKKRPLQEHETIAIRIDTEVTIAGVAIERAVEDAIEALETTGADTVTCGYTWEGAPSGDPPADVFRVTVERAKGD